MIICWIPPPANWLFQETFLAKEVNGRVRDLRINITAFLSNGEKHVHDQSIAGSSLKGDKVDSRHFSKRYVNSLPVTTHAEDGYVLSLHRCLQLLNGRTPTLPQDRVYGALGLSISSSRPTGHADRLQPLTKCSVRNPKLPQNSLWRPEYNTCSAQQTLPTAWNPFGADLAAVRATEKLSGITTHFPWI